MLVSEGKITMSAAEWDEFAGATFAPWMPRTPREFGAMVDLGMARHLAENTDGQGYLHAIALEAMKFGPEGDVNFPIDKRRMAFMKVHGTWPTDDQLRAFEAEGALARPGLTRIK
jgi:hypothetical protein